LRRRQLELGHEDVLCIHGSDPDAGEPSGAVDSDASCHVALIDFDAIEPQRMTTRKLRDQWPSIYGRSALGAARLDPYRRVTTRRQEMASPTFVVPLDSSAY
jgi:hypothetical protein